MQYTLAEIKRFLAMPADYKDKYTSELLNELIQSLYPPEDQADVREYLGLLAEHVKIEGLRIHLAALHLSIDGAGHGDTNRLLANIELANRDYRDLLMAYYL